MLRLEQILAQLRYLPLNFVPAAGVTMPRTLAAEVVFMSNPPEGKFTWRWATTPAPLQSQWTVGTPNELVQGALMAFASAQGTYNAYQMDSQSVAQIADASTWDALLHAAVANQLDPTPYSYVYVTQTLPETLTLWQNGSVVLTSPVNTGIPDRPTAVGTYPIYLRFSFNYMSGFNPDGSYYSRPGLLDQLLQRRRRGARLLPRVLWMAPEPGLRRTAGPDGADGVQRPGHR